MKMIFKLFILLSCGLNTLSRHVYQMQGQLPWLNDNRKLFNEDLVPVCLNRACFNAASDILDSLNTTVDPCDDFYTFACGKWATGRPIPATEHNWGKFNVLTEDIDRRLHKLLEKPVEESDIQPVRNVKVAYKACMDVETLDEKGVAPLVELLDHLGGWPMAGWNLTNTPWYLLVAKVTNLLGVSPILEVRVDFDAMNNSMSLITVDQPSLTLPRYELTENVWGVLRPFKHYVAQSAAMLAETYGHALPQQALIMEADHLVRFETKLAFITKSLETRRSAHVVHQVIKLGRLQELTESIPMVNPHNRIRWLSFLSTMLTDVGVNQEMNEETEIMIRDLNFLYNLLLLIDATPTRVLVNYIQWLVVRTMSRDVDRRMRQLTFQFDQQSFQVAEDLPRWRECVGTVAQLAFAIGYIFVQNHFSVEAKEKVESMVMNISNVFRKELDNIEWMDQNTKEAAKEKTDSMNHFIGFPHWYSNMSALNAYYKGIKVDYHHFENMVRIKQFLMRKHLQKLGKPVDRTDWGDGPTVVNAFYTPTNSIFLPAGILQQPFFHADLPDSLNYGGIGSLIGHEIIHGFDDKGRQGDKFGNFHQWWSNNTENTYLDKAQCFVEQYNQYRVPELDNVLHKEVKVNGELSLGENIADNGGLRAAYRAYQAQVQSQRQWGKQSRLPGLEIYTPDQLFFISFANVWCEAVTKTSLLSAVMDFHPPNRFRVIGTLSNSPEFSAAWNCPKGSPMNPNNQCQLW